MLSSFAAYLARSVKPCTVANYIAAVRDLNLNNGKDNSTADARLLPRVLKGIKRKLSTAVTRLRLPPASSLICKLINQLRVDSSLGQRERQNGNPSSCAPSLPRILALCGFPGKWARPIWSEVWCCAKQCLLGISRQPVTAPVPHQKAENWSFRQGHDGVPRNSNATILPGHTFPFYSFPFFNLPVNIIYKRE